MTLFCLFTPCQCHHIIFFCHEPLPRSPFSQNTRLSKHNPRKGPFSHAMPSHMAVQHLSKRRLSPTAFLTCLAYSPDHMSRRHIFLWLPFPHVSQMHFSLMALLTGLADIFFTDDPSRMAHRMPVHPPSAQCPSRKNPSVRPWACGGIVVL